MRRSDFSSLGRPERLRLIVCALAAVLVFLPVPASPGERSQKTLSGLSPTVRRSLEMISGRGIVADARILSDPKLRGREASTPGARRAAELIAGELRKAGLRPGGTAGSYYQVFKIRSGYDVASELSVQVAGASIGQLKRGTDYSLVHLPGGKAEFGGACVLAGYGITAPELKFDEYTGLDVRGKAVIVFSGTPWSGSAARWLARGTGHRRYGKLAYKARNAADHGAACLLVVDDPAGWRKQLGIAERLRVLDTDSSLDAPIPVLHVTRDVLARMTEMSPTELRLLAFDISRQMAPESMALRGRQLKLKASVAGQARIGRNVIGILPGRDEVLRREAVVIGAHYDHLGEGASEEIYFGANDNAAGVGALLSVARALGAMPVAPRRTTILVAFDAEEIGRRGSKHYVARPAITTAQTALMINLDMIGKNDPNTIFAVGTRSSDEVHEVHQRMNRHVGLELVHPESFRLGRSDHSTFYYANVPILYLFGGLDPHYNTPEDTWEKLIPGKVEKVAQLVFLTALEIAEQQKRPKFKAAAESAAIRIVPRGGRP